MPMRAKHAHLHTLGANACFAMSTPLIILWEDYCWVIGNRQTVTESILRFYLTVERFGKLIRDCKTILYSQRISCSLMNDFLRRCAHKCRVVLKSSGTWEPHLLRNTFYVISMRD